MNIDERIDYHEKEKRKWYDIKERLESKLNKVNEKILCHWAAIQNLLIKKRKHQKRGNMRVCNNELIVKGVIKARCHRKAGHKGQHEKPLMDGSILKWDDR